VIGTPREIQVDIRAFSRRRYVRSSICDTK